MKRLSLTPTYLQLHYINFLFIRIGEICNDHACVYAEYS